MNAATLHPLDAGLLERGEPCSGLPFPPNGWSLVREWGLGYALESKNGLRVIIDCAMKSDNRWWVHVSVSHSRATPTHDEMARVKRDFLGDRYAYAVYPPLERYVNIHHHCLHLWALAEGNGAVLPEFSGEVCGVVSI